MRRRVLTGILIGTMLLILAIIVVPGIISSNRVAKEQAAMRSLIAIYEAELAHRAKHAGAYATLEQLAGAGLIGEALADGEDHDYRFRVSTKGNSFEAFATPLQSKNLFGSGKRSFYVNDKREMRAAEKGGKEASINDPLLGE